MGVIGAGKIMNEMPRLSWRSTITCGSSGAALSPFRRGSARDYGAHRAQDVGREEGSGWPVAR